MKYSLVASTALTVALSHSTVSSPSNLDYTPATADFDSLEDRPIFDEIVAGLRNIAGFADTKDDVELLAAKTCSHWDNKCKKCAEQDTCAFCYTTGSCLENSHLSNQACPHKKGWITSKRKCDGYLTWWAITLICVACICLCPLISFLCFVYVFKKICCGGDD